MSCELYSEDSIKSGNIHCGYCNNDGEVIEECSCGYVRNMRQENIFDMGKQYNR